MPVSVTKPDRRVGELAADPGHQLVAAEGRGAQHGDPRPRARLHRRQLAARDGAEDGVVAQDAGLELPEGRARLDAELVGQRLAGLGVDGDRLLAAAAAIERGHEQRPQSLAGRVLVDEAAYARDQLAVPSLLQRQVAAVLQRGDARLVQPHGLGVQVRGQAYVGERVAPPQPDRLAQEVAGERQVARRAGILGLADEVGEALGVGGHQAGVEAVAVVGALDRSLGQRRSELAEQAFERAGRVGRRGAGPQPPRELLEGQRLVTRQGEHGQQRPSALAGPGLPLGDWDRHRAQQSHLHTWRVVTGPITQDIAERSTDGARKAPSV